MFSTLDLRALADLSATERTFLSVYLSGPSAARNLDKKFARRRRALEDSGDARNEREHFDQNVEMINDYLARNPLESGALCLFACWALDHFQAVPVAAPLPDLVCIDSSPYIRPLAELRDEYENVAVVVADNKRARIYLVSSAVAGDPETVRGNVKNHVRKGGWSHVLDHHASPGRNAHGLGGEQEQVRMGFAAFDLIGGEDAALEARLQTGHAERDRHLLQRTLRGHASGDTARRDRVEDRYHAGHGFEFALEGGVGARAHIG